ncbi:hypothetical protein GCM10009813_20150 [Brevibacterium marinum]
MPDAFAAGAAWVWVTSFDFEELVSETVDLAGAVFEELDFAAVDFVGAVSD